MLISLDDLRRLAVANSLFPPTTLKRALHKLGFVQADPIRLSARVLPNEVLAIRNSGEDRMVFGVRPGH
jgi:uncharacterized protein YcaQ